MENWSAVAVSRVTSGEGLDGMLPTQRSLEDSSGITVDRVNLLEKVIDERLPPKFAVDLEGDPQLSRLIFNENVVTSVE